MRMLTQLLTRVECARATKGIPPSTRQHLGTKVPRQKRASSVVSRSQTLPLPATRGGKGLAHSNNGSELGRGGK